MSSNSNNSSGQHSGLTAQRFEGKPLTQPSYSFRNVPKCSRDLSGSAITYSGRREPFVDSMAEMVLLTKEVMRRQAEAQEAGLAADAEAETAAASGTNKGRSSSKKKGAAASDTIKKRTSKPLSLEYMADRTDVDDPIFGYFVRTDILPEEYDKEVQDANKAEKQEEEKKQQQEKNEEKKEEEEKTEEK